jgi:limonene-1,2-epoxide hydrolase
MADRTPQQLVEQFWQTMNANDWRAVGALLHDDYLLTYPPSGEHIRGRDNFVALYATYPAAGTRRFTVHRLVGTETGAVCDVTLTDGVSTFRTLSYFAVRDDRIWRMTEFWPKPSKAPTDERAQ